jgi:eukaryotic-like serine/threonine-protein kinase
VIRPKPRSGNEFDGALQAARDGRYERAVAQIERALGRERPEASRRIAAVGALGQVARLAETSGDPAGAAAALEAAVRLQPDYPDLWLRRARLLLALQRGAEARQALDRALALNPRYTAARLERALLDASEGFIGEALESLRALGSEMAVTEPGLFEEGLESLARAEWEEAGVLLQRALALDAPAGGGPLERARALLESGDAAAAIEVLQGAVADHAVWPDLHFLLGSAELECGQFDDALSSLARALELHPDFHAARLQFARALEGVGARAQAVEQVMLVLQRAPADPQALELHRAWTSRGRAARPATDRAGS